MDRVHRMNTDQLLTVNMELEKSLKSAERGKKRLPIPLKCSGVPTGETPEDKRKVGERVLGPRENEFRQRCS